MVDKIPVKYGSQARKIKKCLVTDSFKATLLGTACKELGLAAPGSDASWGTVLISVDGVDDDLGTMDTTMEEYWQQLVKRAAGDQLDVRQLHAAALRADRRRSCAGSIQSDQEEESPRDAQGVRNQCEACLLGNASCFRKSARAPGVNNAVVASRHRGAPCSCPASMTSDAGCS